MLSTALGLVPQPPLIPLFTQELLRLAPTLLLIAGYVWFTRRQIGGGGFGGGGSGGGIGGMGGGRGIFNVGKAQVSVLDKKAKKIMFKDVAGCDEAKAEIVEFVKFLKVLPSLPFSLPC